MTKLYIYHKDWEGTCIIENNQIFRENMIDEFGTYEIINNKLLIKWDKWNEEEFYYYNNSSVYYVKDIFENKYSTINVLNKDNIQLIILDKNNNNYILYEFSSPNTLILNKILEDTYTIDNDLIKATFKSIIYKNIYSFSCTGFPCRKD